MLTGHPQADRTRRYYHAWLASLYGCCPRCGGPRAYHLTRPTLRCEQGCG